MTTTREQIIEAAAKSDAKFDGRDYDAMGRVDRERYFARCEQSLSAIASLAAIVPREATEEQLIASNEATPRPVAYIRKIYAAMVETGDLSRERKD